MKKLLTIVSIIVLSLTSNVYSSSSINIDDSIINLSKPNFAFTTHKIIDCAYKLQDNGKFIKVKSIMDDTIRSTDAIYHSADGKIGCGNGISNNGRGNFRAFIKTQGKLEYLTYPASLNSGMWSGVSGINASGIKIAGTVFGMSGDKYRRGFVWTREQGMTVLSNSTATFNSSTTAISQDGRVIGGWSEPATDKSYKTACVWDNNNNHYILKNLFNLQEEIIPSNIHLTEVDHFSPNLKALTGRAICLDKPDVEFGWLAVYPAN